MQLGNLVPCMNENGMDVISEDEDLPNVEDTENIRLCRVCLVKEVDTLIIPCRHAQTCKNCTETIASSEELNNCPVCRGPIQSFLQIFLLIYLGFDWGYSTFIFCYFPFVIFLIIIISSSFPI